MRFFAAVLTGNRLAVCGWGVRPVDDDRLFLAIGVDGSVVVLGMGGMILQLE